MPYRTTDLQCTGDYKYWLAAASGLCSGQFVELKRSMYLNCGGRAVSNRLGSVWLSCDVWLCWWCWRERKKGERQYHLAVSRPASPHTVCYKKRREGNESLLWKRKKSKWQLCKSFVNKTYLLTYSTQHSPSWEADQFTASQEISNILHNPMVHYRIKNCPTTFRFLSHINSVHTTNSHFLKIHLNIILPSAPGFSK